MPAGVPGSAAGRSRRARARRSSASSSHSRRSCRRGSAPDTILGRATAITTPTVVPRSTRVPGAGSCVRIEPSGSSLSSLVRDRDLEAEACRARPSRGEQAPTTFGTGTRGAIESTIVIRVAGVTAVPGAGDCESTMPTGPGDSAVSARPSGTPGGVDRRSARRPRSGRGRSARLRARRARRESPGRRPACAAGSWPSTIVGGPGLDSRRGLAERQPDAEDHLGRGVERVAGHVGDGDRPGRGERDAHGIAARPGEPGIRRLVDHRSRRRVGGRRVTAPASNPATASVATATDCVSPTSEGTAAPATGLTTTTSTVPYSEARVPAGGDCSRIVPISAGSTRSPTPPSVRPASPGGRSSVSTRSAAARRGSPSRRRASSPEMSGTSTVHGVASVIRRRSSRPACPSRGRAPGRRSSRSSLRSPAWDTAPGRARARSRRARPPPRRACGRGGRASPPGRDGDRERHVAALRNRVPGGRLGGEDRSRRRRALLLDARGRPAPSGRAARAPPPRARRRARARRPWAGVATTRETRAPSLTTVAAAGACSSTMPGGSASVSRVETGPSCRPARGEGLARRGELSPTNAGTAMPVRSTRTSRNCCSSRSRLLPVDRRRRVARDEEAGARGVGGGAAEEARLRARRAGPSAISKVALASTVCASAS